MLRGSGAAGFPDLAVGFGCESGKGKVGTKQAGWCARGRFVVSRRDEA